MSVAPRVPAALRCSRLVAAAALLLAADVAVGGAAADGDDLPPAAPIRDLDYGDVLFRFFQDDYFAALVRLEVARDLERLPHHAADAELLAGGLYLSLGMHAEAARRFERLLTAAVPQSVADQAYFYLARIGFQRGYVEEAWHSLQRVRGPLRGELEPERQLLAANVLMALGRHAEAAERLDGWIGRDDWARYAGFNLGVALVRSGQAARGRQFLQQVGAMPAAGEEQLALRDRANLALGYALLQDGEPELAVTALSRVRLQGPFSNRALLGLGWAEADAARPQRALVPWLELRERPLVDAAVLESLLAVPYAYAQLAATGEAARHYRLAVDAYAAEVRRIDESIAAIRGAGFLDAVLWLAPDAGARATLGGWRWQLENAPDAPQTRYLYQLLASHEFQEGLGNYRDLRVMQRDVEHWSEAMLAFEDMIDAREAAAVRRGPRRTAALAGVDPAAMERRRDALAERLAAAVSTRDVAALATPEEAAQWRGIAELSGRIDALPASAERGALAERARLLKGTLLWQLDADYRLRAWRAGVALRETDAALSELHERYRRVEQAGELAPRNTARFAARVDELEDRLARLRPRLAAAATAQERLLAGIAVRELEAQKSRLLSYAGQAQFALAALYDNAAAGGAR